MIILCLGDSLTFGTGAPRGDAWIDIVQKECGCRMVNRGVPGDTTGGMLARFGHEVDRARPQLVSLLGGTNDIFASGDDRVARANITALANQTAARGLTPIVCAPPPLDPAGLETPIRGFIDVDAAQAALAGYAAWLGRFAALFSYPFVDFWSCFSAPAWRVQDERLYCDGIHPSSAGHILMAEVFAHTAGEVLACLETA